MSFILIGELAARTGVSVSALHFYERKGLIKSTRNDSNHRIFPRSIIRRVTVIQIAQKAGLTLREIGSALRELPSERVISAGDWKT
ncbi:MAG: MerR family transcriptional regulator, partial [Pseudomonadota bacterium]